MLFNLNIHCNQQKAGVGAEIKKTKEAGAEINNTGTGSTTLEEEKIGLNLRLFERHCGYDKCPAAEADTIKKLLFQHNTWTVHV